MRHAASSLALVLFAIGLAWGADPPTLEELAAGIEKVRSGPDGERVVLGHISRKLGVSVDSLRAQRAQTSLDWGQLLVANLLCKGTKLTVDQVAAEFRSGVTWEDIARHRNVSLDQLIRDVRQSQQAMERREEDRAPPRGESPPSEGAKGPAATSPIVPAPFGPAPSGAGSGRRY